MVYNVCLNPKTAEDKYEFVRTKLEINTIAILCYLRPLSATYLLTLILFYTILVLTNYYTSISIGRSACRARPSVCLALAPIYY